MKKGGKGRKAGASAAAAAGKAPDWEWARSRDRVLRALGSVLNVEFTPLFAAPHEKARMVGLVTETVRERLVCALSGRGSQAAEAALQSSVCL